MTSCVPAVVIELPCVRLWLSAVDVVQINKMTLKD